MTVGNAWHERAYGIGFAAGFSLLRVKRMLDGLQRLAGAPVARRRRVGVRPRHLREGVDRRLRPAEDPLHADLATLFESALVGDGFALLRTRSTLIWLPSSRVAALVGVARAALSTQPVVHRGLMCT